MTYEILYLIILQCKKSRSLINYPILWLKKQYANWAETLNEVFDTCHMSIYRTSCFKKVPRDYSGVVPKITNPALFAISLDS